MAAKTTLTAKSLKSLGAARAGCSGHAARHLADCTDLAWRIPDVGTIAPHDACLARMRRDSACKAAF